MLHEITYDASKLPSFPKLAVALRSSVDAILLAWQQNARVEVTSARKLLPDQLRDDLPRVLHRMANTFDGTDVNRCRDLTAAAAAHGFTRSGDSYSIDELLAEHAILRPLVIEHTTRQLGRPMTAAEAAALHLAIDNAARSAATCFVAEQQQHLRTSSDAQIKYLAFLSHDLRGGLNGVMLTAELLKRQLADEPRFSESIDDIDSMRRAIMETVATMDRFLHAERFRHGKVRLTPAVVQIGELLTHFGSHFALMLADKRIELRLQSSHQLTVHTDRHLLSLILQNLIGNAIKYTAQGVVRVLAEPCVERGGVRISITDQGPGIPPENLPNLFEAFTRGDTHGQAGVGLGLYIVRQAADLIGAHIVVNSTPGEGTTFVVELPPEADA